MAGILVPIWALLAAATAAVLVVCLLAVLLWILLHQRSLEPEAGPLDLSIDISSLDASGPPMSGPRLEFYGTPVRLAVFVLAPVGRDGVLPSPDRLIDILEQLIPGLSAVLSNQTPILRFWPSQLSSVGFTNAFFHKLPLPGDRGKGTPWCSIAGKFTALGQPLLAGMVCCARRDNGLSQVVIQHEGQWNDVLRVRS